MRELRSRGRQEGSGRGRKGRGKKRINDTEGVWTRRQPREKDRKMAQKEANITLYLVGWRTTAFGRERDPICFILHCIGCRFGPLMAQTKAVVYTIGSTVLPVTFDLPNKRYCGHNKCRRHYNIDRCFLWEISRKKTLSQQTALILQFLQQP